MKTLGTLIALVLVSTSLHAGVIAGPITNAANGHLYYLLTPTSWLAAEAEAVTLGGHLATINDAAENAFVITAFGSYDYFFIGLTDKDVEGSFRWIDGDTSSYRNWDAVYGSPGNLQMDADFVLVFRSTGLWRDVRSVALTPHNAVVEVLPGVASFVTIRPAVEVAWTSQTTNRYQVQWASTLNTNNWFNLGPEMQGTGATTNFFDSTREGDKRFYRVLTLP
jgi:hypothetical protein